jgi:hypothetical protein
MTFLNRVLRKYVLPQRRPPCQLDLPMDIREAAHRVNNETAKLQANTKQLQSLDNFAYALLEMRGRKR